MMSKIWTYGIQLSDWVENIAGNGEIARYEHFFSFSHNVFKSCLVSMRQKKYLWGKRLTDKRRNFKIEYFAMLLINAIRVRLTVTELANCDFINVQANNVQQEPVE